MTTSSLLKIIDQVSREKRLKTVKVWDVFGRAQKTEDLDKEEIWMFIRKLETNAFIDVIRAQDVGIVAVSLTPLGETKLEE